MGHWKVQTYYDKDKGEKEFIEDKRFKQVFKTSDGYWHFKDYEYDYETEEVGWWMFKKQVKIKVKKETTVAVLPEHCVRMMTYIEDPEEGTVKALDPALDRLRELSGIEKTSTKKRKITDAIKTLKDAITTETALINLDSKEIKELKNLLEPNDLLK